MLKFDMSASAQLKEKINVCGEFHLFDMSFMG